MTDDQADQDIHAAASADPGSPLYRRYFYPGSGYSGFIEAFATAKKMLLEQNNHE